jgi:hypothetical protein
LAPLFNAIFDDSNHLILTVDTFNRIKAYAETTLIVSPESPECRDRRFNDRFQQEMVGLHRMIQLVRIVEDLRVGNCVQMRMMTDYLIRLEDSAEVYVSFALAVGNKVRSNHLCRQRVDDVKQPKWVVA